jgi:5S rRNA maturation endonuclease (ribonuclease M5)
MLGHSEERRDNKVEVLSTHLKRREEKIQHVLECLIEEAAKGTPIIVEGKKDIRTLKTLGVQGKIVSAKTGGKSYLDVVSEAERVGSQNIILLLDFDRRGKELTEKLRQDLEKVGIKPNLTFWNELFRLLRRDVKDVEGLAAYVDTLRKKIGEI